MFQGEGLVVRTNRLGSGAYNFKSLKWNQGYYKYQLFKEIINTNVNSNVNGTANDNTQKNNYTTTVSYDIYD